MPKIIDKNQPVLGGQAIINRVMIKSSKGYAMAVYNKKKLILKKVKHKPWGSIGIWKYPILRGMANLLDMLIIGMKALNYSTEVSEGEKTSNKEFAFSIVFAVLFAIGLFIILPAYLAKLTTSTDSLLFDLVDGLIRIAIFLAYLVILSLFKDIKDLFKYHGAEHMSVHCYEHNLPLTVKNVMKFDPKHPRCGTSFLILVLIISIVVFSFIRTDVLWIKMLGRVLLGPLIVGLSYEIIRTYANKKLGFFMKLISVPGMWLQYVTTKKPSEKHVRAAIAALKEVQKIR